MVELGRVTRESTGEEEWMSRDAVTKEKEGI